MLIYFVNIWTGANILAKSSHPIVCGDIEKLGKIIPPWKTSHNHLISLQGNNSDYFGKKWDHPLWASILVTKLGSERLAFFQKLNQASKDE